MAPCFVHAYYTESKAYSKNSDCWKSIAGTLEPFLKLKSGGVVLNVSLSVCEQELEIAFLST